ncbi:MAG: hypothetical protein AAB588_01925 [Patescibacteria group bacterium]
MGLTATELKVVTVFANSQEASSGTVANQIMISPGYAEYLCKYLSKEGYLERTHHGTYGLTLKGKDALRGRTYQPIWDKGMIQSIAQELAKQLVGTFPLPPSKQLPGLTVAPKLARKEIKIKDSFIHPLGNEVKLKYAFSQKPRESRTSGTSIEKTLKALRAIAK